MVTEMNGMALLKEKGIQVKVYDGANEVLPEDEDGKLGYFEVGTALQIEVTIPPLNRLWPIVVHRHMHLDGSHVFSMLDNVADDGGAQYRYTVIARGNPDKAVITRGNPDRVNRGRTEYPGNQIHIVLFHQNMRFTIIQVSLACQRSVIYLRAQVICEDQVKQGSDGYWVGPNFAPWSQLLAFLLAEKRRRQILETEPVEPLNWDWVDVMTQINVPPPLHPDNNLSPGYARMQFWNECNAHGGTGWGIACDDRGKLVQVKVHWSQIVGQKGFVTLYNGALVSFGYIDSLPHSGGPNSGSERYELRNVTLVEE